MLLTMDDPLTRYVTALEQLDRTTLDDLLALCDPDMHFRDPFNDSRGVDAFGRVMQDMFAKLDDIRFRIDHMGWSVTDDACALIHWSLDAKLAALGGKSWQVEGCSMLRFGADGQLTAHYDYWDAATGLYERLPVLGRVLGLLRRRIRAD